MSRLRLMAERDGLLVGWGDIGHTWWAFHPRKFNLRLNVDPSAQRQGIGSALFERLVRHAEAQWEPMRIGAETRENRPHSISFLEHRGFALEHRRWESCLQVSDARLERFEAAQRRLHAQGILVQTLAEARVERGADVLVRQLFELDQLASRDEPGYDPQGAMRFDQFVAFELDPSRLVEDGSFVALLDDALVGVSRLLRDHSVAGRLHVGFTGVHPAHRGRGIAMALKLRTVAFAREHGYQEIRTQNDEVNGSMLHINELLGFKLEPAWLAYGRQYSG
jgi:GNAT superfamily N-acetyltransferase